MSPKFAVPPRTTSGDLEPAGRFINEGRTEFCPKSAFMTACLQTQDSSVSSRPIVPVCMQTFLVCPNFRNVRFTNPVCLNFCLNSCAKSGTSGKLSQVRFYLRKTLILTLERLSLYSEIHDDNKDWSLRGSIAVLAVMKIDFVMIFRLNVSLNDMSAHHITK